MESPTWLMCAPDFYDTQQANNVWMAELAERTVNRQRAMAQWEAVYEILTSQGHVYLLPPTDGLQDQVFTANTGVTIGRDVIVSHHATAPRRGEEDAALNFFAQFSTLTAHACPAHFEGEADFKHLHDDIYAAGHGIRTERAAVDWIAQRFDVKPVLLEMTDEYLYHLDCSVFPLDDENTLVCTEMFEPADVEALAQHTNVIDVSADEAFSGVCNSLRAGHLVLNGSHIHELSAKSDEYREELAKNRKLEDLCSSHDLEPVLVNISEFHKGGALLSCLAMRLA